MSAPWLPARRAARLRLRMADVHSAAAACAIPLLAAFATCGLVYGNLPLYFFFSAYVLQGLPCLAGVGATLALLAVPVLRFFRLAAPRQAQQPFLGARRWCLRIAAALWVLAGALDFVGMSGSRYEWMIRPLGLDPAAQWPLLPLPWAWAWLAGFAGEPVKGILMILLLVIIAVDLVVSLVRRGAFGASIVAGMVWVAIGKIAEAAGRFAAGHGLLPGSAFADGAKKVLADDPGVYNTLTWLYLWTGIGGLLAAALVAMVAFADEEDWPPTRPM